MNATLHELFGVDQPIIAMVHLPGLPGRPLHDRAAGMDRVLEVAAGDLEALQSAGVDGLLFCNEADLPYQLRVGQETVAAMAFVIGQLKHEITRPFGVDLVWDPSASLAVARACGAAFVREVVTGVSESDLGLMRPSWGDVAAYRSAIGAEHVAVFANVTPEFASSAGTRTVAQRAASAAYLGVDVVLVSGPMTGAPTNLGELRAAKAATEVPVLANTGVSAETVGYVLGVADGAIVGTSLKRDGVTVNPVDPARAARLMTEARRARKEGGVGEWPSPRSSTS